MLQWPCRPRRGVSLVQLEQLARDGPILADTSRLMKVRTCNKSRAEAAVGIMMSHGRYLVPPALGCDRTFLQDPRDAGYVESASAMLFRRAGRGDIGEILPMAMLPAWWQFPLPGLPKTLDVPTRVGHGVRRVFHALVTHEECLMYHDRSCPPSTVSRGRYRFIDLNPYMGELGVRLVVWTASASVVMCSYPCPPFIATLRSVVARRARVRM